MTEYKVVVYKDGGEIWRNKDLELHREGDLPAVLYPDGHKAYYTDGKLTRETGPARIYSDGDVEYWINGKYLTKEEFVARSKPKHEGQVVVVDGVEYELSVATKGTK